MTTPTMSTKNKRSAKRRRRRRRKNTATNKTPTMRVMILTRKNIGTSTPALETNMAANAATATNTVVNAHPTTVVSENQATVEAAAMMTSMVQVAKVVVVVTEALHMDVNPSTLETDEMKTSMVANAGLSTLPAAERMMPLAAVARLSRAQATEVQAGTPQAAVTTTNTVAVAKLVLMEAIMEVDDRLVDMVAMTRMILRAMAALGLALDMAVTVSRIPLGSVVRVSRCLEALATTTMIRDSDVAMITEMMRMMPVSSQRT
jgi:hypothetical protein